MKTMRIKFELNSIRLGVYFFLFSLSERIYVQFSELVIRCSGSHADNDMQLHPIFAKRGNRHNLRVNEGNRVMNSGERGGGA